MDNPSSIRSTFYRLLSLIGLLLLCLLGLYFYKFHGKLSVNISDWSNFSTFITGIITMCLTALNVWVFFILTTQIANKESREKLLREKMAIAENFRKELYSTFTPDHNEMKCSYDSNQLANAFDYCKSQKMFIKTMPVLNTADYDAFVNSFQEFGKLDYYNDPTQIGNTPIERRAYNLFQSGLDIYHLMLKNIAKHMELEN